MNENKGIDININIHIDPETLKNFDLNITPEDINALTKLFSGVTPSKSKCCKNKTKKQNYIERCLKNANAIQNQINEEERQRELEKLVKQINTPNLDKYRRIIDKNKRPKPITLNDEDPIKDHITESYKDIIHTFKRIQNSMYEHDIPIVELEFELDDTPIKFVIQQSAIEYVTVDKHNQPIDIRLFPNFEDLRCESISTLKPLLTQWDEQTKKLIINTYKNYLIINFGMMNP